MIPKRLNIPENERKIFTISNFLSLVRILLLPFIAVQLKHLPADQDDFILLALVAIVIATDYLDGFFARRLNQVSALGKILDPLADKICIGTVVILLMLYRDFPIWLGALILGRDILIILAGLFILSAERTVTASNIVGKIAVNVLALLVLSYMFHWTSLQKPATYLSIMAIFGSLISYGIRFWRIIKTKTRSSH